MNLSFLRAARPLSRAAGLNSRARNYIIYHNGRNIFIKTERTPNVKSMKFLPSNDDNDAGEEVVLPERYGTGMHFDRSDKKEINRSPLAKQIFELDFVKSVFLGRNFVTVTKNVDENWRNYEGLVFDALMNFYVSGKPVIEEAPIVSDTAILDTDSEVVATIKELMETRVRPSVQEDGGDIFYEGFEESTGESIVAYYLTTLLGL